MHNKDNTYLFYEMFTDREYKTKESYVLTKEFTPSYPRKESAKFVPDKLPRQLRKK